MVNQNEITSKRDLLNSDGEITEEGYARKMLWKYNRKAVKASWLRIKEWDYYYIIKEDYCISVTVADLGYIGFAAVAWMDFKTGQSYQSDTLTILPRGKTNLPPSSEDGDVIFKDKNFDIQFIKSGELRTLDFSCKNFKMNDKIGLKASLKLIDKAENDSIVIATSWKENRKRFYYNQKINNMPVEGTVIIGNDTFTFEKSTSMAGLDWGRGAWTYKNRWYWASASGYLNGMPIGWNLGYGFTDRSPASENMIFYKGVGHKLENITFEFDRKDYSKPWKFTSNNDRFEMDFKPIVDRYSSTNLGLIKSIQHQVFGTYTGYLILDDGTKLEVKDFIGFAEDVLNHW